MNIKHISSRLFGKVVGAFLLMFSNLIAYANEISDATMPEWMAGISIGIKCDGIANNQVFGNIFDDLSWFGVFIPQLSEFQIDPSKVEVIIGDNSLTTQNGGLVDMLFDCQYVDYNYILIRNLQEFFSEGYRDITIILHPEAIYGWKWNDEKVANDMDVVLPVKYELPASLSLSLDLYTPEGGKDGIVEWHTVNKYWRDQIGFPKYARLLLTCDRPDLSVSRESRRRVKVKSTDGEYNNIGTFRSCYGPDPEKTYFMVTVPNFTHEGEYELTIDAATYGDKDWAMAKSGGETNSSQVIQFYVGKKSPSEAKAVEGNEHVHVSATPVSLQGHVLKEGATPAPNEIYVINGKKIMGN